MHDYLDDLEGVGPTVAAAIRDSRPSGPLGRHRRAVDPLNLKGLIAGTDPRFSAIPPDELTALLDRLKTFAKRSPPLPQARQPRRAPRGDRVDAITRCPSRSPRSSTISPVRSPCAVAEPGSSASATTGSEKTSPGCSTNHGSIPDSGRSSSRRSRSWDETPAQHDVKASYSEPQPLK